MTRMIISAVLGIALLATASASQAASGIDALKVLSTLQAQAAAEDGKAVRQQQAKKKKKRPVSKPVVGDIKGEATDDKHATEIDIQ